jgi:hypothetical protein
MLTSLVGLAQAIAAGKIGVIDDIKIGDVVLSALTGLSGRDSVTVTERAVQAGFLVTEGIIRDPIERTLDIVLADPQISIESGISAALSGGLSGFSESWRDKKDVLYSYLGQIVAVTTHEGSYPRMILKAITPIYDVEENWDCFIAQVELREWDERSTEAASDVDNAITAAEAVVGGL